MSDIRYIRLVKKADIGKNFKGVWIGKEHLFMRELTLVEKVILSVIAGFRKGEKDCFVSSQTLSEICSCNRSTITRAIASLEEQGYLLKRFIPVKGKTKRILQINYKKKLKLLKEDTA